MLWNPFSHVFLCAEQGNDLDEFFRSTAGMIFNTAFYSRGNLQLFKDLTSLTYNQW